MAHADFENDVEEDQLLRREADVVGVVGVVGAEHHATTAITGADRHRSRGISGCAVLTWALHPSVVTDVYIFAFGVLDDDLVDAIEPGEVAPRFDLGERIEVWKSGSDVLQGRR